MTEQLMLIFTGLALIYTIVSHELGHAYVAYLNGDNTAKNAGRLTLNPLKHLDLMGTLFLIVFRFGWAKPVPINEANFRNKRRGLFLVSIAGVSINMISAILAILIILLFNKQLGVFSTFFEFIAFYGILFAVFNLLPIPPLDGSKILASFLPNQFKYFIYKYERYFFVLFMIFLLFNRQTGFLFNTTSKIFNFIVHSLVRILGNYL